MEQGLLDFRGNTYQCDVPRHFVLDGAGTTAETALGFSVTSGLLVYTTRRSLCENPACQSYRWAMAY